MPRNSEADKTFTQVSSGTVSSSDFNDGSPLSAVPTGTYSSATSYAFETSVNETRGSLSGVSDVSNITQTARQILEAHPSKAQATQALQVLDKLESLLEGYRDLQLPEIQVANAADGSLAINWKVAGALFGIAIQPDTAESSWFLLHGDVGRGFRADGNLNDLDFDMHLAPLLDMLKRLQIRQRHHG